VTLFLVFLAVALVVAAVVRIPRMLRRSEAERPPEVVGLVAGKRIVDPVPGSDGPAAHTRYQLQVDLDGGVHWTWCDQATYERTRVGDEYTVVDQSQRRRR